MEIEYWDYAIYQNHALRYLTAINILDIQEGGVLCDWGCGPLGGVLPYLKASKKIGVEPLWKEYEKYNLDLGDIIKLSIKEADKYKYDKIITINAIDHGDSDFKVLRRFHKLLKKDGEVYMHVNLRTKEQLNEGHNHVLTYKQFKNNLKGFKTLFEKVYTSDPLPHSCDIGKRDPYKTLICHLKKI